MELPDHREPGDRGVVEVCVRFEVTELFDVTGRGRIAAGLLRHGVIRPGQVLHDLATGRPVLVRGLELHTRQTVDGLQAAVLLDPNNRDAVERGTVLVSREPVSPGSGRT